MIYRFTLRDDFGVLQFGTEKVANWDEIETSIVASGGYNGLMSEFTSSFSFVDTLRTRMLQNKAEYGINARVYLTIEVGNENRDTASFERIGKNLEFIADFASSRVTELTFELDFFYSDFYLEIKKSEKEKIDFTNKVDIKGNAVTPYEDYMTSVQVEDRLLQLNSQLKRDEKATGLDFTLTGTNTFSSPFPFEVVYNSDQGVINARSLSFVIGAPSDPSYPNNATNYFLYDAQDPKTYDIDYNGSFRFKFSTFAGLASFDLRVNLVYNHINYDGQNYVVKEEVLLRQKQITINPFVVQHITIDFTGVRLIREGLNIEKHDYLGLQISIQKPSGDTGADYTISNLSIEPLNDSKNILNCSATQEFEKTQSKAIHPHEAFSRYIELMTGRKDAFYSKFFGRTELGYQTDGEGANMMLCNGYMLRGLDFEENPFNTSFNKLFESFHNIFCLTAFVEQRGDKEVFRVEKFTDVYNNAEVVDLGSLIADYELNINEKLTFNEIKIGYKDNTPETLNGLEIYNGEVNYSVDVSNSEAPLSIISEFITADYIIEETRRKWVEEFPTEDTKYDKNIFLLSCYQDGNLLRLKQPRLTGDTVTGCLSPERATNYDITPARILRNWGAYINAITVNVKITNFIQTKTATNSSLVTQIVGTGLPISEKGDVLTADLDNAIFTNENLLIGDCVLTTEQYKAIVANNYGTVKVTDVKGNSYWGYINKLMFNPNAEKGNFELILSNRKNG